MVHRIRHRAYNEVICQPCPVQAEMRIAEVSVEGRLGG